MLITCYNKFIVHTFYIILKILSKYSLRIYMQNNYLWVFETKLKQIIKFTNPYKWKLITISISILDLYNIVYKYYKCTLFNLWLNNKSIFLFAYLFFLFKIFLLTLLFISLIYTHIYHYVHIHTDLFSSSLE